MTIEVRVNKFYTPEMKNKKPVLNAKGKPKLIPCVVRQAYLPNPVPIDGIKGFIVTCRTRNGDKRKIKLGIRAAEFVENNQMSAAQAEQWYAKEILPLFTVNVVRDAPPPNPIVRWAKCPAGVIPKWGQSSEAIPLQLTQELYHQQWYALEGTGEEKKILGQSKDKRTLEREYPNAEYFYGYLQPMTIGAEKRLRVSNEVKPDMQFIGQDRFSEWARHYMGNRRNALMLVDALLGSENVGVSQEGEPDKAPVWKKRRRFG